MVGPTEDLPILPQREEVQGYERRGEGHRRVGLYHSPESTVTGLLTVSSPDLPAHVPIHTRVPVFGTP